MIDISKQLAAIESVVDDFNAQVTRLSAMAGGDAPIDLHKTLDDYHAMVGKFKATTTDAATKAILEPIIKAGMAKYDAASALLGLYAVQDSVMNHLTEALRLIQDGTKGAEEVK